MSELTSLGRQMRADSERWFPEMHADPQVPLPVFYALGLSGEVGEVANEVKKGLRGHQENGVRHIDLAAELADVFTYLLLLADELGVDIVDEYAKKRAYNEARWSPREPTPDEQWPEPCPTCSQPGPRHLRWCLAPTPPREPEA